MHAHYSHRSLPGRCIKLLTLLLLQVWAGGVGAQPDTTFHTVFMGTREAGVHKSWIDADGTHGYYYTFNDRGRGPVLTERITFDQNGALRSLSVEGLTYAKSQVEEHFRISDGIAHWTSASEEGSEPYSGQYYYPISGTIAGKETLIRMLEQSQHGTIPVLPFGIARVIVKEDFDIEGMTLTLFGITGVSFSPEFYWMDRDLNLFAVVSPARGISCLPRGREGMKDLLVHHQVEKEDAYYRQLALERTRVPEGRTAIWDVDVFNSMTGKIDEHRVVAFEGDRIVLNDPVVRHTRSAFDEIIDGAGKTLLPGFFDMHVHVGKSAGPLHIAGGVTSVRDMAVQINMIESKKELADNFASGSMIGPRIIGMCGFIDGAGPFTRDMGIDHLEQGLQWIDRFAEEGLTQIKLYSSIKPEWVKPLARRAHEHGMVVSGHIPAFMTATEAIADGFDEIQHTNMLFLNFYGDTLDTRNMTRFTAVGERGHSLDFQSPAFNEFVDLLLNEEIVIDPTLAIFEWGFTSVTGEPSPAFAAVIDQLPLSERRNLYTGGFARAPGLHSTYLESYNRMVAIVGELHRRGVRIVPGTDNIAGHTFHRELELYVQSGIPVNEVLQLATIRSAEVAGVHDDLGSIETGKIADMVLIEGDILRDISNVRNVLITVKGGLVFEK